MPTKLKGLAGQGMNGRKRSLTPVFASYPPGSYTFTAPTPGAYRFVLWGGGASVSNGNGVGGSSGAFVQIERVLNTGQVVSVVVGTANTNTVVTLPSGEVATAGRGDATPNTGGVATVSRGPQRGDILLNGSAGSASDGAQGASGLGDNGGTGGTGIFKNGAGAPGYGRHRGGNGADYNGEPTSPGGGGAQNSGSGGPGSSGLALIYQIRMTP